MTKVLIIDDDRTMVSLLTTLLEMDGFEVAEVRNWGAILETVRSELPDLVLMDFFLPQIEGLEVITQMRGDPELADIRIIMTSGMDVSDQCLDAGADTFLLKPYTPDQLLESIQANLV
ncbi:MAG: response regulator [Anaerolineales bacterium]|nr:response regulator [Anaerolineales bacterium]